MSFKEIKTFGLIDYCVFATMLLVSTGIGVFMSFRGNKSPEDFLFGNRAFKPLPVALSLLTSIISSIAILGYSGEVYAYGLQISSMVIGIAFALTFCNFFILPVLFPLKLTSINEYIDMRFKSKPLRILVLLSSFLSQFLYSGICLYAPTLALSSVTPLSATTYIYLLGVVCTFYSTIGGIKAVVWTDVFQLAVVAVGLITIMTLGCYNVGGITKVWELAKDGGRLDIFNMSFGIYERRSFFNVILYGFFYFVALHGTAQLGFQRMGCVQTIKEAKCVLLSNIFGYIVVFFTVFACGIICYATYASCDPLTLGKISKSDQILTFFVVDKLGYITGLPGLFVAILIGGALSSISSVISAQVSMIWKDCLLHFNLFSKASPETSATINKVLSMFVGIAIIGMALLASRTDSLVQLNIAISGAAFGPVMGLFMLGLFLPKCNTKGAWCGLVTSWIFMCWLSAGGLMFQSKSIPLTVSIENCSMFANETHQIPEIKSINGDYDSARMWFYGISSTLYPAIGTLLCMTIGVIASKLSGSQSLREVSPWLVTPCVRRFYWNKQDLLVAKPNATTKDKKCTEHSNNNISI